MSQIIMAIGAINCFLSVALGAFGAHGLKNILSEQSLQVFNTGVHYHFFHALGLILIGLISRELPAVNLSAWFILAGIILFSGSLYLLSFTGTKIIGIMTPIGGLCFMIGWVILAIKVWP